MSDIRQNERLVADRERITAEDFCRMFNCSEEQLPEGFLVNINRMNTWYRAATLDEFQEYSLHVLKLINSPIITRTIDQNLDAWEKGWTENLNLLADDQELNQSLKPRYFRPSKFLRYNQGLIVTDNLNLEYDLFVLARSILFSRYLYPFEHIYEFGCGSCQNLLGLAKMFPDKNLYGLDWTTASIRIAKALAETRNLNIEGISFDMMNPSGEVVLKSGSAVFTVHALEQLGQQHQKLLSFLLKAKPAIVFHYEPIVELYAEDNFLDYLALLYSEKRNYLCGFLPALQKLEEQNKIEILELRRPYLGGVIHESSLIVWRPLVQ